MHQVLEAYHPSHRLDLHGHEQNFEDRLKGLLSNDNSVLE